jgi:hypothetical protein
LALTKITEGIIADGAVPTTGIVGVSTFTSSGTWTKATRESALGVTIKRVIVEVQGGGGGGASDTLHAEDLNTGAGGGYARKLLDVSSVSSATITVGTGGSGGSAENTPGGDGGASSWADGVNTNVVGNGGEGGPVGTLTAMAVGGTGTGGDINIQGQSGQTWTNHGGSSVLGFGGVFVNSAGNPANNAVGYGGGGSNNGATPLNTGEGSQGIVIVTEIAG